MHRQVDFEIIITVKKLSTDLAELTVEDIVEIANQLEKSPIEVFETILTEIETSEELVSKELSE